MATVSSPEYDLIIGAPGPAFDAAVAANIALGFAPLGVPYVNSGSGDLEQVMFRGAIASFIALHAITSETAGTAGTGAFLIAGDFARDFNAGYRFTVDGSTSNDGTYSVKDGGSTFSAGFTTIPVNETVVASATNGSIQAYAPSILQVNPDHV